MCTHRRPRVLPHTTAVVSGEGPVHRNPALDSVSCLDALFQHTEGKEGLRRGDRAGGGEGLTPCSLSLAHLEVPIRSASPGQWPEVSGRVEPSFPWPHSQELGSCGTLLPFWGSSEGSGRQDPGSLASLCWRNTPSGRIRTARSAGPPRWAPPDSGVGSQGRGFPGYRAPDWLPRGQVTEPLPALLSSQGATVWGHRRGQRGKDGPFPGFRDAGCQPPGTRSDLIRASTPRQGGHSPELSGQGAELYCSSPSSSASIYCVFH